MQTTETLQAQAGQESVLALAPRRHHKMNRRKRNEYIMGWVFISPLTIGFLLFTAVPLVLAIYYSFTSYDLFSPPQWVGLANFAEIFAGDTDWYMRSLLNALIYTIGVPLGAAISLVTASRRKCCWFHGTASLFLTRRDGRGQEQQGGLSRPSL